MRATPPKPFPQPPFYTNPSWAVFGVARADARMVEPNKRRRRATGKLHAAALAARVEAVSRLGGDADRFRAAVDRYVNAVEVADQARRSWEAEGRPLWTAGSMGQQVEHPLIRTMDRLDTSAGRFGAALGLDPQSEKRLASRVGRPAGAVSAPDRVAPPVVKLRSA